MTDRIDAAPTESSEAFVGFCGETRIAAGSLAIVAVALWRRRAVDPAASLLAFDRLTGEVIDLDLRGAEAEVLARYSPPLKSPAQRGRPKLGVVAREVTLLPRHWDWLGAQPGGASVTLRRLVETARQTEAGTGAVQKRAAAAYRFMAAMAGDCGGFEEAARALFAGDMEALEREMAPWPPDWRNEILGLWLGRSAEGSRPR